MSYHQKYVFRKKTIDINVKVLNLITTKSEAKAMTKHSFCNCKCKFNSTTFNSKQKENNKTCLCNVKIFVSAKKIIVGILAYVSLRIASI